MAVTTRSQNPKKAKYRQVAKTKPKPIEKPIEEITNEEVTIAAVIKQFVIMALGVVFIYTMGQIMQTRMLSGLSPKK